MGEDDKLPAAFLSEASELGFRAATSLTYFISYRRITRIAINISLSAALLADVAKQVNENRGCFKTSFEGKFRVIAEKAKWEYEAVLRALDKFHSWKPEGEDKEPPKTQAKRFSWALDAKYINANALQRACLESAEQVLILEGLVSLVLLQIRARERELSPSERNKLRRLRQKATYFVEELRDAGIATVVAYGLADITKPRNTVQIASTVAEATLLPTDAGSSTEDSTTLTQKCTLTPPSSQTLNKPSNHEPSEEAKKEEKPKLPDILEMWQANTIVYSPKAEHSTYRILGIPLRFERTENQVASTVDKIIASQEEIKTFMEKNTDNMINEETPTLDVLIKFPPIVSNGIYRMLDNKNATLAFHPTKWSVERILRVPRPPKPVHQFWTGPTDSPDGHIVIIRGVQEPRGRMPPPPPRRRSPSPASSLSSTRRLRNRRKAAIQIELNREEAENVLNDFLASFSTLYDGIPVEKRGAELKSILLPEDDDRDGDSGSDSSSDAGSMVND